MIITIIIIIIIIIVWLTVHFDPFFRTIAHVIAC